MRKGGNRALFSSQPMSKPLIGLYLLRAGCSLYELENLVSSKKVGSNIRLIGVAKECSGCTCTPRVEEKI